MEAPIKPKRPGVRKILARVYSPKDHNVDTHYFTLVYREPVNRPAHRREVTVKEGQKEKLKVVLTRSFFSRQYYVRCVEALRPSENEAAKKLVKAFQDKGYQGVLRKIKLIKKELIKKE